MKAIQSKAVAKSNAITAFEWFANELSMTVIIVKYNSFNREASIFDHPKVLLPRCTALMYAKANIKFFCALEDGSRCAESG